MGSFHSTGLREETHPISDFFRHVWNEQVGVRVGVILLNDAYIQVRLWDIRGWNPESLGQESIRLKTRSQDGSMKPTSVTQGEVVLGLPLF